MSYYNTTGLVGPELQERIDKCKSQEDKVLVLFKSYPKGKFTPADVHKHVLQASPLTSVRRAITDLTNDGHLIKLEERKKGNYGHPNRTWRLRTQSEKYGL